VAEREGHELAGDEDVALLEALELRERVPCRGLL
jgi:hypothetical protein